MMLAHTNIKDNSKLNFEEIPTQGLEGVPLRRARIQGGWLVALSTDGPGMLCFIPDQYHLWNGRDFSLSNQ